MRLHALQYLRAVAAIAVVYSHAAGQVPSPFSAAGAALPQGGALGVDIFFVISGFIMVWISKPEDTPTRFMVNRVRRVVPLYWFFTLLMAAVLLVAPQVFENSAFDLGALGQSLAFLPFENPAYADRLWPVLAPGWSLNYEMYFYLLFALSLLLAAEWRAPGVAIAILAVFLLAHAGGSDAAAARFLRHSIVFEFVFGMALALAWRKGFRLGSAGGVACIVAGVALFALDPEAPHIVRYGLPALLVVTGSLYVRLPEWRWAVVLGDASYSLYLSHIFVLGAMRKLLPPLLEPVFGRPDAGAADSMTTAGTSGAWAFVVLSILVCLAVSVVVHVAIDGWLLRGERLGKLTASLRARRTRHARSASRRREA